MYRSDREKVLCTTHSGGEQHDLTLRVTWQEISIIRIFYSTGAVRSVCNEFVQTIIN